MRIITVPTASSPARLDVFLSEAVPGCSRRTAQRAIAAGDVRVNGRRVRKGYLVAENDLIHLADAFCVPPTLQPNPRLSLRVLYEDDAVIAVDKPAGMPSHALRSEEQDTVANFLLARHPELAGVGENQREPGLVHRLDTDTSGVLLAARTVEAYRSLRQQFSRHQVLKEYLALVEGAVAEPGVVRAPIAHDQRNRRKMRVAPPISLRARQAVTYFRPLEAHGKRTLLAVRIPTGVMHQIRAHLASIGHPIVGDRLYGTAVESAPRQLLHAAKLGFHHPTSGEAVEICSPLPADFAEFLSRPRTRKKAAEQA